jgi:hypothetical protein
MKTRKATLRGRRMYIGGNGVSVPASNGDEGFEASRVATREESADWYCGHECSSRTPAGQGVVEPDNDSVLHKARTFKS